MGANLVRRLMRAGHECVVYDVSPGRWPSSRGRGPSARPRSPTSRPSWAPRAAWIMVPAAYAGATADELAGT